MAYNYSEYFLVDNKQAVQWLVHLAKEGKIGSMTFEDPAKARNYRYQISSLLACLAYNHPDLAWVKNSLRTWIDRTKDGTVIVQVGPESRAGRKLRGPRSRAIEVGVDEGQTLELQEILGQQELIQLAVLLTGRTTRTQAKIMIPPSPEGIEYLRRVRNEETGLGFEVLTTEPHLVLQVVPTSANVALPSQSDEVSP